MTPFPPRLLAGLFLVASAGCDALFPPKVHDTFTCVSPGIGSGTDATEFATDGRYLYWARDQLLSVYDPSLPVAEMGVGGMQLGRTARGLAIAGTRAFVSSQDAVTVLDVADPKHPAFVGELTIASVTDKAIVATATTVFVGTELGSIHVIDVSGALPVFLNTVFPGTGAPIIDLLVAKDTLYVAAGSELFAASAIPVNGDLGTFSKTRGDVGSQGLAYANGTLFGYQGGRIQSFDLTDPRTPTYLATNEGIGYVQARTQIWSDGATVFTPGIGGGGAWDVSDPTKLGKSTGVGCGQGGHAAAAFLGGRFFLAGSGGLSIAEEPR